MDHAANPYGMAGPRPGKVCLCAGCGDALLFCEDMTLRAMTPDEFMAMPVEHRRELIRLRGLLAAARKTVRRPRHDRPGPLATE